MTANDNQKSPMPETEAETYDPFAPTKGPIAKATGELARVVLLACAGFAAIASVGSLHWACDLFTHFTMQALVGTMVATMLAFALLRRKWGWFGVAICLVLGTRFIPANPATTLKMIEDRPDAQKLKLIVANVQTDAAGYGPLLDFLRTENPDVFMVMELSKASLQQLTPALKAFPYRQQVVQQGSFGIGIYSKLRIAQVDELSFDGRVPSLLARIELPNGSTTQVLATHPFPPVSGTNAASRNQQLEAIGEHVTKIQEALIVAGDLNCSPWSRHFKAMLRAGKLHDTGSIFQPTWPSQLPWPLRIPIDHVLVNDHWTVLRRELGPPYASDHLPILTELQLNN